MMQFHKYLFLLSLVFTLSVATGCGDADGDSATLNNGGGAGKITTRKVAIADVYLSNARFSPDGKRFALVHDDGEVEALATLGVDGKDLKILSEDANYLTAPTWTSDGASIIFYSEGEISSIAPDGSNLTSVFSAFAAMEPDLSPDDGYLIYGTNGGNLKIVGLQTRDEVNLDFSANSPRYSPDGTQIAYITDSSIRVMDAQGANPRDITTDTEDLSYLSSLDWFPDGERLAITSKRGIEIVDVESGTRTTLIDDFATKAIDVSPDGKSLVFGINGQKYLTVAEGL